MTIEGSDATIWDDVAPTYESERSNDTLYLRCIDAARAMVEENRPAHVLDMGCGTGMTTLPLCRSGRNVFACDFSRESLKVLQRKPGAPPVAQADICVLPFRSQVFDAVLCANTLQHLGPARQRLAIRELLRVVRPGGVLVLTVHHYSKRKRLAGWIKEGKPGQPGIDYIYRFTVDDLLALLPRDSRIGAAGLRSALEPYLPFALRAVLARRGYGHMLLAVVPVTAAISGDVGGS